MKKRGIGVASMFYGMGYGFSRQDIGSAEVEICEDGSVTLRSGEVDYGQGSDTIFCQIVAEELGIRSAHHGRHLYDAQRRPHVSKPAHLCDGKCSAQSRPVASKKPSGHCRGPP
jgi:CO/xanthine dehydrogenase Mo-binding subunit